MTTLDVLSCSVPSTWDGEPCYRAPNAARSIEESFIQAVPPPLPSVKQLQRHSPIAAKCMRVLQETGPLSAMGVWRLVHRGGTPVIIAVENALTRLVATGEIDRDGITYQVPE